MDYFDDVKKKRMTRDDHMRRDAWKEDEGAGYRKGSFGSKGRSAKPDMYRKDERGGYHSANGKGGKIANLFMKHCGKHFANRSRN